MSKGIEMSEMVEMRVEGVVATNGVVRWVVEVERRSLVETQSAVSDLVVVGSDTPGTDTVNWVGITEGGVQEVGSIYEAR